MKITDVKYNDNDANKMALCNLGIYVIKMVVEPKQKTKMSYEFRFNKETLN